MATARFKVRTDTRPLRTAITLVEKGLEEPTESGPFGDMRRKWIARYSAFVREEFDRNSKGGGDWPPLAVSTLKRRRQGSGSKTRIVKRSKRGNVLKTVRARAGILRDTGVLFNALNVGAYGNLSGAVSGGIEFGFQQVPHGPGGGPTISDIASFHQAGGPRLPQRIILHDELPESLVSAMARDAGQAVMSTFPKGAKQK